MLPDKQKPINIPDGLFQPPDTRCSFVEGNLWIVRLDKNEPAIVVDISASSSRCFQHEHDDCEHIRLARAEHQRLFKVYGPSIPDTETVMLDAVMNAFETVLPPSSEEGAA